MVVIQVIPVAVKSGLLSSFQITAMKGQQWHDSHDRIAVTEESERKPLTGKPTFTRRRGLLLN
jgi:hypothetical protein